MYIIAAVFYIFLVALAIIIHDIEEIFNVVGALGANAICYLLPALFYIMLAKKKNKHYYISWIILVFFSILGIICIIAGFMNP